MKLNLKHKLSRFVQEFRNLNLEAKLGVLFLIPPTWGVIVFILNIFNADIDLEFFPESWNAISDNYGESGGYAATPAIPLYLGLMAIAGSYLIKGNLPNKKHNDESR